MTANLSFADLTEMWELGGYEVSAELDNSSALLALMGLTVIQQSSEWLDYGDGFAIQLAIAEAINQLWEQTSPMGDYVKMGESVYTSDQASCQVTGLDPSGFSRYKVFISGMYSDKSTGFADKVRMRINGEDQTADYTSYSRYSYSDVDVNEENVNDETGIILSWPATCNVQIDNTFGAIEITLYPVSGGDIKGAHFSGYTNSGIAAKLGIFMGQGTVLSSGDLTSIYIEPVVGDYFLIDPLDDEEPDELRITVYGLK